MRCSIGQIFSRKCSLSKSFWCSPIINSNPGMSHLSLTINYFIKVWRWIRVMQSDHNISGITRRQPPQISQIHRVVMHVRVPEFTLKKLFCLLSFLGVMKYLNWTFFIIVSYFPNNRYQHLNLFYLSIRCYCLFRDLYPSRQSSQNQYSIW